MKIESFSDNAKLIMDQLIATNGPSVAFRLFGVLEYARGNPDLHLRDRKRIWSDVELLKKSGLYPETLKPAMISDWSRFLFSVNFNAALVIAKIVPVKTLIGEVSDKEMAAARAMLKNYAGLKQFDDVDQPHPAWKKSPK